MPSRERGIAGAAIALVLTGLLFAAVAAWTLVERSMIPVEVDGTVTAIEVRPEKHPGVDDVWMIRVDDEGPRHVDADVAHLLHEGARVEKEAWTTDLTVDGEHHALTLSDDARAMLVLAPMSGLALVALALTTHRHARSVARARV